MWFESLNSIPVISQLKSVVDASLGNVSAAEKTQQEFCTKCIVISQLKSVVLASMGDFDGALMNQIEFADGINAVPILSQIKSLIQSCVGDNMGALNTQIIFSKECAIISQIRSAVEAYQGDYKSAYDTQVTFIEGPGLFHVDLVIGCIALPMTFVSILGLLGFASEGIAAGSTATVVMAWYGGFVPAVSVCAVFQSIGATGVLPLSVLIISGITGGCIMGSVEVCIRSFIKKDFIGEKISSPKRSLPCHDIGPKQLVEDDDFLVIDESYLLLVGLSK